MITFYNTLTQKSDVFTPQEPGTAKIYTCGPTVYNYLHIGNWVAYIYWDILVRMLAANDIKVNRVMNITDVGHLVSDEDDGEDKMQKGARRENKTAWDIAKFYGDYFIESLPKLNILPPTHLTRATDFIQEQLELVRTLKKKGHTYQISDGIYFDTTTFPTYAEFARLNIDDLRAGARVEFNKEKRNPGDFALWKFSPDNEKRDMEWETPEDILMQKTPIPKMGFPGWHIECSAMAMNILGATLDIHTGGIDHIPVHHTNEIAQSEAATGERFAHTWIHNNHLKVDGTKISKSLDNGYTIEQLEERGFSAMDFRLFVLQSHYQTEGNFTFENLESAKNRLAHWQDSACLRWQLFDDLQASSADHSIPSFAVNREFLNILNVNLNTPGAIAFIDTVFNQIEKASIGTVDRRSLVAFLGMIDDTLGISLQESTPDISDAQKQTILARARCREDKEWRRSDELRDELLAQGIVVRDTPNGAFWSYLH